MAESPQRQSGEPPREGAWGVFGVATLLGLFVLAIVATLHALLVTLG